MNYQKLLFPAVTLGVLLLGYNGFGWPGVAIAGGGVLMFLLLHFTRMMQILKRAAQRPAGHVASAVMLNAKLKPGVNLLHVIAMTRSLGDLQSPKDAQPELFRWTDDGGSHVTCEFQAGKLVKWTLWRPPVEDEAAPGLQDAPAASQTPQT